MRAIVRGQITFCKSVLAFPILSYFSVSSSKNINKAYQKGNMIADAILRNYFSNRSELSNIKMVDLFNQLKNVKVSSGFFNDHRWVHLNVVIQKNLPNFSIAEQFKILQALTKLNHYNELFNSIFVNILGKLESLYPDQKAALFYFMAKRGKVNPEVVKTISNSLLQSLKSKSLKITYPKLVKKSQGDEEEEQLFPDTSQAGKIQEIGCRNVILCFWSLQKMRIKDNILSDCILKEILRPRIKQMPASYFPLFLSALWLHGMENKRIFGQITYQLKNRQKELSNLDRDKLKMLICMLCKPEISQRSDLKLPQNEAKLEQIKNLSEIRQKLVLWLMETLIISHEDKKEFLFSTSAYQILTNASEANINDTDLFQRYLSVICSDLTKIETKQLIYLLSIIRRLRGEQRIRNRQTVNKMQGKPKLCDQQYQILSENLQRNILSFLHKFSSDHPARALVRKMVIQNFIQFPKSITKKIIYEQKTIQKQKSHVNQTQRSGQKNVKKSAKKDERPSQPRKANQIQSQKSKNQHN